MVKIIKANENFFAEIIYFYFNKSLGNGKFSNCLELANITPGFKAGARTSKNNYRSVSTLPVFSKTFERLLTGQLLEFFGNIDILSIYRFVIETFFITISVNSIRKSFLASSLTARKRFLTISRCHLRLTILRNTTSFSKHSTQEDTVSCK